MKRNGRRGWAMVLRRACLGKVERVAKVSGPGGRVKVREETTNHSRAPRRSLFGEETDCMGVRGLRDSRKRDEEGARHTHNNTSNRH